jgi:hypothetical protein
MRAGGLYVVEDVKPDCIPEILEDLARLHPGCPSFVVRSFGTRDAIVIRKPQTEPMDHRLSAAQWIGEGR